MSLNTFQSTFCVAGCFHFHLNHSLRNKPNQLNTMQFLKFNFKMEGQTPYTKHKRRRKNPIRVALPCLCECGNGSIFARIASNFLDDPFKWQAEGFASIQQMRMGRGESNRETAGKSARPSVDKQVLRPLSRSLLGLELHLITPIIRFIAWQCHWNSCVVVPLEFPRPETLYFTGDTPLKSNSPRKLFIWMQIGALWFLIGSFFSMLHVEGIVIGCRVDLYAQMFAFLEVDAIDFYILFYFILLRRNDKKKMWSEIPKRIVKINREVQCFA